MSTHPRAIVLASEVAGLRTLATQTDPYGKTGYTRARSQTIYSANSKFTGTGADPVTGNPIAYTYGSGITTTWLLDIEYMVWAGLLVAPESWAHNYAARAEALISYALDNWSTGTSDSFGDKLNLAIASGDIPDAMVVVPSQFQQLVAAGALEDLTPYIDEFANADLLENYAQTNGVALAAATVDGTIMGIPNVQPQADAPLMAWVRQDWLDAVGMEGPETLDDLVAIAQAFIEQDPDGNGADAILVDRSARLG